MKSRKKLWIACAALAVVVVMCAFALLYRPAPYRFLEGSRYEKTEDMSDIWSGTTYRYYRVRGTMESVFNKAQAELTPHDGWMVGPYPEGVMQFFRGGDSVVIVGTTRSAWLIKDGRFPDVPGTVLVFVDDKPTLLDHFLHWVGYR